MARRRARGGQEIRAKVSVDTRSLDNALGQLERAVRDAVVESALRAGGGVIQRAAISKAPGPGIVVEMMSGKKLGAGTATGLMKKNIRAGSRFAVVGPDKQHWYYRFLEYGTKDHGVTKRKRTVRQQQMKRLGLKAEARSLRRRTRPAMKFTVGGRMVFARKVRGFAEEPFMEPAAESAGKAAQKQIEKVLLREIESVRG